MTRDSVAPAEAGAQGRGTTPALDSRLRGSAGGDHTRIIYDRGATLVSAGRYSAATVSASAVRMLL